MKLQLVPSTTDCTARSTGGCGTDCTAAGGTKGSPASPEEKTTKTGVAHLNGELHT